MTALSQAKYEEEALLKLAFRMYGIMGRCLGMSDVTE
jgi:hypothetical protein